MNNRKNYAAVVLLSMLLLGGCAAPTASQSTPTAISSSVSAEPVPTAVPSPTLPPSPTAEPDDDMLYSISLDSGTLMFDSRGNIVENKEGFSIRKDILTGEPAFQILERTDVEEQRNENGYPTSHQMTALYNMEGKLLHDWAEYAYPYAFGDYAVRMDSVAYNNMGWDDPELDEYMALWNYKTGEDILLNVYRAERLSDNSVLLSSTEGVFMGIFEIVDGKPTFRPAPEGYRDVYEWNGKILANPAHGSKNTLMNSNFETILSEYNLNGAFFGLNGPYMIYSDTNAHDAILNEAGEKLFATTLGDEQIDYFDGDIALIRRTVPDIDRRSSRRMVAVNGTELTGDYSVLLPGNEYLYGADQPAPYFLGLREGTVNVLDRSGKVTASKNIAYVNYVKSIGENLIGYTVNEEKPQQDNDENQTSLEFLGVLDTDLNVIVPANKYLSIGQCTSWWDGKRQQYDLLNCRKEVYGISRWDILDPSGKVLIENLTQVGDVGPNRIAVVKGFSVGLMDWQGNWIAKQSIFDKLEDEKGDIWG